ncbi:MAG: sensor histidine kinase [Ferruginibacter sp.]
MRKRALFFLYFLIVQLLVLSQTASKKDSLLHILQATKEDTARVRLLMSIQKLYATKNYDSSFYYLNEAANLAQKIKTDQFDFIINTGYAEYYYYNNNYKKALEYALKNKGIAEEGNDMKLLAKSYNNLAAVCNHFGQHKAAIAYILKCLDISEKTKDSTSFPVRNLTASNTYYNLKQFDKSIAYAKKAILYGKQFDNSYAVMMGLNNLSAAYSGLNMLDSGIIANKQQLEMAKQDEDVVNIVFALVNLCQDYFKKGDAKALENYSRELAAYVKEYPDNKTVAEIYSALALNQMAQRRFDLAKIELDSGISIATREHNLDGLENLYQNYAVLNYMQGKIKEGENFSYKYDSVVSAENIKELNFYTEDLETKYETEKKEARIKLQQTELKQKSNLNFFLIAGSAALLLILLLGYRNYRNRQKLQQAKIDELETEKQLTATEAVLKGQEQERTRLAKDLHDGLGGMLSGIKYSLSNMKENLVMTPDNMQGFERSIDMLDSSISEMRRVAHNMMPEVLVRYGLDAALREFCNEIERSGVIQINYVSIAMEKTDMPQISAVTIYRIVQELVNNVIKHAAATQVLVQAHVSVQEKQLAITVEDNGKGFDTSVLGQQGGIGWKNIQNRVEFLKGKLDVQSAPGRGTSVMIEIDI